MLPIFEGSFVYFVIYNSVSSRGFCKYSLTRVLELHAFLNMSTPGNISIAKLIFVAGGGTLSLQLINNILKYIETRENAQLYAVLSNRTPGTKFCYLTNAI